MGVRELAHRAGAILFYHRHEPYYEYEVPPLSSPRAR